MRSRTIPLSDHHMREEKFKVVMNRFTFLLWKLGMCGKDNKASGEWRIRVEKEFHRIKRYRYAGDN
jgi:hypothetical protein